MSRTYILKVHIHDNHHQDEYSTLDSLLCDANQMIEWNRAYPHEVWLHGKRFWNDKKLHNKITAYRKLNKLD